MIFAGLLYLGLFALAASMNRHAELLPAQWWTAKHGDRVRIAWFLILMSLVAALWSADWPMRLLAWVGLAPVAGGIVLLGLTYGVGWARITAPFAILLVLVGIILGR